VGEDNIARNLPITHDLILIIHTKNLLTNSKIIAARSIFIYIHLHTKKTFPVVDSLEGGY